MATASWADYIVIWPEQRGILEANTFDLCLITDLEPPTQLTGHVADSTTVVLQWQPGAAARSLVERKRDADAPWQLIAKLQRGVSTYQDTNLVRGETYRYRVMHEQDLPCGNGVPFPTRESPYTNEVSVTLPPPPPPPPSMRVWIDGSYVVPGNTVCTWTAVVQGGTPPYRYVWRRDGVIVGNAQTYSANTGSTGFALTVEVKARGGAQSNAGIFVIVDDELGSC